MTNVSGALFNSHSLLCTNVNRPSPAFKEPPARTLAGREIISTQNARWAFCAVVKDDLSNCPLLPMFEETAWPLRSSHPETSPLGYCTVTYLSVCTWYVSFSWTSVSENVTVKCTLGKWVNIRREILFQENKSLIKPEKCSRIQWGLFLFSKKIYTSPGKKARICIRTFSFLKLCNIAWFSNKSFFILPQAPQGSKLYDVKEKKKS